MVFDIKQWIPEQVKNKWFWFYVAVVILNSIVLNTDISGNWKIAALVLFIFSQYKYNVKIKYNVGIRILNWILFINMIILTFAYASALVKELNTAAICLLITVFIVLIGAVLSCVSNLLSIKDSMIKHPVIRMLAIIILYGALAVSIIVLFASTYLIMYPSSSNGLVTTGTNMAVTNMSEIVFFSASVFYTSAFGNIVPIGLSKLIFILECFVSYVTHVIILGYVLSSFSLPIKKN